jgi:hypothetical protein
MLKNMIITALLLLGSSVALAAPLNDLYFGLDNMRGFQEVYWWFLADGRVLHGLPASGLTPADFDAACAARPGFCGTYALAGDKLSIKYRSGETQQFNYKPLNGGFQLNYLILTPVKKYPAGTRLNGVWHRASSAKIVASASSGVSVTVPSWITFKSDGTFTQRVIAGVDTVSSVKGANVTGVSDNESAGTYSIQDYVLTLVKNGKTERHTIFPAPGDNLNIDGMVYMKGN